MDLSRLSDEQRRMRMNIRNFLLIATPVELNREVRVSLEKGDAFRAECVRELLAEYEEPTRPPL